MLGRKSSATVQQIQPLASSMISSALQLSAPHSCNMSPSMPISPNSLTIKARRLPLACMIMSRMSVVLPDPKKPVITVAGMREVAMVIHLKTYCVRCKKAEPMTLPRCVFVTALSMFGQRPELHAREDHAFDILNQIGQANTGNQSASKAWLKRVNRN